jgi:hypothetical protein
MFGKPVKAGLLRRAEMVGNERLAEREGFEPSVPRKRDNGFRDRPVRPLRHLSWPRTQLSLRHGYRQPPPAEYLVAAEKTRAATNDHAANGRRIDA